MGTQVVEGFRPPHEPIRHRLAATHKAITHKFTVGGQGYDGKPKNYDGYLTVGLYPNGQPGEIFVRFAKMGGRQGALLDAWCTMVSIALQYGIPFDVIVRRFRGVGFEPRGMTYSKEPALRICTSPLDYIVRWLEWKFPGVRTPSEEISAGGKLTDAGDLP